MSDQRLQVVLPPVLLPDVSTADATSTVCPTQRGELPNTQDKFCSRPASRLAVKTGIVIVTMSCVHLPTWPCYSTTFLCFATSNADGVLPSLKKAILPCFFPSHCAKHSIGTASAAKQTRLGIFHVCGGEKLCFPNFFCIFLKKLVFFYCRRSHIFSERNIPDAVHIQVLLGFCERLLLLLLLLAYGFTATSSSCTQHSLRCCT